MSKKLELLKLSKEKLVDKFIEESEFKEQQIEALKAANQAERIKIVAERRRKKELAVLEKNRDKIIAVVEDALLIAEEQPDMKNKDIAISAIASLFE